MLLAALTSCAAPAGTAPAAPQMQVSGPGRITNADPAMAYRAGTSSPALAADYTAEQITGAQRTFIRFLADEAIGPRTADPAAWWKANSARFAPAYRPAARLAGQSADGGLLLPNLPAGALTSRTITIRRLAERTDGAIMASAAIGYTYLDDSGASRHATGTAAGVLVADPLTGAWLIDGFQARAELDPGTI